MAAANSVGQKTKSVVAQVAAVASKQAGEVLEDVTGDIKEQIGLAGPASAQAPQDFQTAAQPDVNQIQADDIRRKRDRMQALQAELAQIAGKTQQSEESRLREIRDPRVTPAEEAVLPVPSSKQGRQMRGMPGANKGMQRQLAEVQSAERTKTVSQ